MARKPQPPGQIRVLVVGKIIRREKTRGIQRVASVERGRARGAENLLRRRQGFIRRVGHAASAQHRQPAPREPQPERVHGRAVGSQHPAGDHGWAGGGVGSGHGLGQPMGVGLGVGVKHGDPLAGRNREPGVAGSGKAGGRGQADKAGSGKVYRDKVAGDEVGGPVGGAVIHHDQFEAGPGLGEDRAQTGGDDVGAVAVGHDDRDQSAHGRAPRRMSGSRASKAPPPKCARWNARSSRARLSPARSPRAKGRACPDTKR